MKSMNLNSKALEWLARSALVIVLSTVCNGQRSAESSSTMFYMCPPEFIRLGSSCYYFSKEPAVWQDAHFSCKDRDSNLTAPERWEDKHLREYLNKPEIEKHERWIGGMYDWGDRTWKWGGQMKQMNYQSFARMRHLPPEQLQWHCIAMDPAIEYRWSPVNCMKRNYYICQAKLSKVHTSERNRLRQKWNPNGNGYKPNEVRAPNLNNLGQTVNENEDNELRPNLHVGYDSNSININHRYRNRTRINNNPKTYIRRKDQRLYNDTAHALTRLPGRNRNNKKPFKGYKLDNTEAAYLHNIRALRSGKTGLSDAQIEKHLKRLERMRRREMAILRKKEKAREKQNMERSISNNIDSRNYLNSNINNLKNRNLIDVENARYGGRPKYKGKNRKKASHSIENVTQKTYLMNNQLTALHPKTIVEVHDFSSE